jgi:hypothetical protein
MALNYMLPGCSFNNAVHGSAGHVPLSGQPSIADTTGIVPNPDGLNLFFRKSGLVVLFSPCGHYPTFHRFIPVVVRFCSDPKMIWVAACGVIAFVKNTKIFLNVAMSEFPRISMCKHASPHYLKGSVPAHVLPMQPLHAAIGIGLTNMVPEVNPKRRVFNPSRFSIIGNSIHNMTVEHDNKHVKEVLFLAT